MGMNMLHFQCALLFAAYSLSQGVAVGLSYVRASPCWVAVYSISQGVAVGLSYYMAESLHITAQRITLGIEECKQSIRPERAAYR